MKTNSDFPNIVLFYVKLPIALNEKDFFKQPGWEQVLPLVEQLLPQKIFTNLDKPLAEHCAGRFIKLGEGAFLIEEDACYPAIIAMIKICNESSLQYIVAPLSDLSSSIPPNCQGWTEWLEGKGKCFRLTGFQPRQELKKP
jgi:hypothetical protein